jgi:hypothetical protein
MEPPEECLPDCNPWEAIGETNKKDWGKRQTTVFL